MRVHVIIPECLSQYEPLSSRSQTHAARRYRQSMESLTPCYRTPADCGPRRSTSSITCSPSPSQSPAHVSPSPTAPRAADPAAHCAHRTSPCGYYPHLLFPYESSHVLHRSASPSPESRPLIARLLGYQCGAMVPCCLRHRGRRCTQPGLHGWPRPDGLRG